MWVMRIHMVRMALDLQCVMLREVNVINLFLTEFEQKSGILINTSKTYVFDLVGHKVDFIRGMYIRGGQDVLQDGSHVVLPEQISILIELYDPYAMSILFHEMAHATGHPKRLDRIGLRPPVSELQYGIEECIAEMTARALMEYFGLATKVTRDKSNEYLAQYELAYSYSQPGHIEAEVARAKDYILSVWLYQIEPKKQKVREILDWFGQYAKMVVGG